VTVEPVSFQEMYFNFNNLSVCPTQFQLDCLEYLNLNFYFACISIISIKIWIEELKQNYVATFIYHHINNNLIVCNVIFVKIQLVFMSIILN